MFSVADFVNYIIETMQYVSKNYAYLSPSFVPQPQIAILHICILLHINIIYIYIYIYVYKITADGVFSHEIKRRLLLGKKAMTSLLMLLLLLSCFSCVRLYAVP